MNTVRKVKMTMPYDELMVVIRNPMHTSGRVEPLFMFSLKEFTFKNGNTKWIMKTPEGGIMEGGLDEKTLTKLVGGLGDVSVVLSMPITLHKRSPAISPEFILLIPESLRVYPLSVLKKKYGTNSLSLFR